MLHEDDVLPQGTESPFLSALHAKNVTAKQTFSAINLASQPKTTKLFFSSQVAENNKALLFFSGKEQIKLLAVPFKSSRCCLRSDKLVNCHV